MLGMKKQPFKKDELWYHFSKWAPEPNFKKLYYNTLERTVTVLYNAVATRINVDASKLADSIELANFNGGRATIPVNNLLIATGSIEASRLLLASDAQVVGGLGNQSGWLGKCFMEHPCIEIGVVATPGQYKLQKAFNTHLYKKRKYSVRISLAEKAQRDQKVLNASMGIMFDYNDGRVDPYVEVRKYLQERKVNSIPSLFTNMGAYLLSAKALVLDKLIYKHNARARAVVMMEQEPLKESAITLSNEIDVVGMRKASLNWQISHKTWDTVVYASGVLKRELKRLGFGDLNVHAHINSANTNWASHLTDVNHHMGGTRMSATRDEGVVSTELQVWGHPNIYVCSCSVFPTVSHSNPTLTMMALCIRLVNKLTAKN
jgi:choline dehydrogenase-like flavoprotein